MACSWLLFSAARSIVSKFAICNVDRFFICVVVSAWNWTEVSEFKLSVVIDAIWKAERARTCVVSRFAICKLVKAFSCTFCSVTICVVVSAWIDSVLIDGICVLLIDANWFAVNAATWLDFNAIISCVRNTAMFEGAIDWNCVELNTAKSVVSKFAACSAFKLAIWVVVKDWNCVEESAFNFVELKLETWLTVSARNCKVCKFSIWVALRALSWAPVKEANCEVVIDFTSSSSKLLICAVVKLPIAAVFNDWNCVLVNEFNALVSNPAIFNPEIALIWLVSKLLICAELKELNWAAERAPNWDLEIPCSFEISRLEIWLVFSAAIWIKLRDASLSVASALSDAVVSAATLSCVMAWSWAELRACKSASSIFEICWVLRLEIWAVVRAWNWALDRAFKLLVDSNEIVVPSNDRIWVVSRLPIWEVLK